MPQVLIVEDSPTQAAQLAAALSDRGFEVTSSASGEEGLSALELAAFDIVISDVVMPGISGYDFCRKIKSNRRERNIPVILLTSLHEPMDIIRGLESGADNFLTKPYQTDDLIRRIEQLLKSRRMREENRLAFGIDIFFLGHKFTVTSDKEQILDLLLSIFEDTVKANQELQRSRAELAAAKSKIQLYASELEERVRERTAELTESEARLDRAQAIAQIGSWEQDVETGQVYWSKEMYRIRGVPPTQAHLTIEDAIHYFDPADGPQVGVWFGQLRTGHETHPIECHIRRPDGEIRTVSFEGKPFRDASGKTVKIAGTLRDITERRLAHEQLVQAQKMEAIGNLTGGMAHDFNNLLGIIVGNLDLLIASKGGDAEVAELAGDALDASLRGAELTKRLLAFARRQPLRAVRVDVNAVVSDITKLLARTIGEQITLDTSLDLVVWPVTADPAQLESSLTNLATNAHDAMPNGGRLTITTRNAHLDPDYAAEHDDVTAGDYVLIEVSDTGVGMPPDVMRHIFEPFYTTKERGKGTGLGLSMVFGFMKQSGGHINVYSEPGVGTTFRLYLPRTHENVEAVAPTKEIDAISGQGETVLVVEDNASLRRVVVKQLQDFNYRVVEAEDATSRFGSPRTRADRPPVHGHRDARRNDRPRYRADYALPMAGNAHHPHFGISACKSGRGRAIAQMAAVRRIRFGSRSCARRSSR